MTILAVVASLAVAAVAASLLLPVVSDALSLLRVLGRRAVPTQDRDASPEAARSLSRLLFLVAAHDEESAIDACCRSLLGMDYPADGFTVLVVADNCSDRTAQRARSAGVTCLERNVPDRPGKPHAIRWALRRFDYESYDALVIVDADTRVDGGLARALARRAPLRGKAVQSFNGISNPDDNGITYLAAILSEAVYRFFYPLKQRAGLNVPLTGAGMCVGTSTLGAEGWNALSLAEDVEMYTLLTMRGVRTEMAVDARVYSEEASSLQRGASQRRRWRAGRLAVLFRHGPRILRARNVGVRQRLDLLSELATPGPALHLSLAASLTTLCLLVPLPGGGWLAWALLVSLVRPGVGAALAVGSLAEPGKALRAIAYLPVYAAWRLLVEIGLWFGLRRPTRWVRTERNEPGA